MKQHTFLHTFFKPPVSHNHLVVIPSSCSVSKPILEHYNDKTEKQRLISKATEYHITLTLPYDDNIFCGRYQYFNNDTEYTHPPQMRANMLFEAICAKTKYGYKYQFVYLSEGYGSQDVLIELKKIILLQGPLPKRRTSLKIYGFDDAAYLQSYLGQNGICTPVYYSKGLWALMSDISQPTAGTCLLKPLNVAAKVVQELSGWLFVDKTHPQIMSSILPQPHKNCFILSELDTPVDMASCLMWANATHQSNVIFILSHDTPPTHIQKLIQYSPPNIPIFSGAPVGHGCCLNHGRPMTLFAPAVLSTPSDVPVLSWADTADFAEAA